MGFEVIRTEFVDYLTELSEQKGDDSTLKEIDTENESLFIFQHAAEFKDYLRDNNIANDDSVLTKSIDSIMSMDIVDGNLVDSDALNALEEEQAKEGEIPQEAELPEENKETEEMQQTKEGEEAEKTEEAEEAKEGEEGEVSKETDENDYDENNLITDLLNYAFNDELIKQILDTDESGELDKDEIREFLETLVDEEGNITFDILADAIMNQVDEYNEENAKKDEDDTESLFSSVADNLANTNTAQNIANTPAQTASTPNVTPNYGVNPTSSGGSYSPAVNSGVSPSSAAAQQPQGLAAMNLEQLQQVKAEREANVEQARQSLDEAYSGDFLSSELKEEYEAAQADYLEKLEKDSSELKDEQEQCFMASEEAESNISSTNVKINKIQSQIDNTKDIISDDKTTIDALEEALKQLNQTNGGNQQAEIEQKKADVKNQLAEARAQKEEHEQTLEGLNENLKTQQEALLSYENARTESLDAQSDIESKIKETCSAGTKEAYNTFKEIKESIEKAKEKAIEQAKAELVEAQNALSEVNEVIKEKKTQKILSENRGSSGSEIVDYALQFASLPVDGHPEYGAIVNGSQPAGDDVSKNLFSALINNKISHGEPASLDLGGWCYNFARMVYDNMGVKNWSSWYDGNVPLWDKEAHAHEVSLDEAQPGDIIVYDWPNNDNNQDHIGIFIDKGDGTHIHTIEGNTMQSGGYSYVRERTDRNINDFGYHIYSIR